MTWADLERCFLRAILYSCTKKKLFITFPILVLCGILTVFCRALAFDASDWISLSLIFLPILLSSGILLALGVVLIRIYHHEVNRLSLNFRRLITGSMDLIMGTSYLSIPPVLVYMFLWIVLGIFFMLQQIPGLGDFFSVVFSFGPFLLIFCSLLLCFFNLALLFFVAPVAALQPFKRTHLASRVWEGLKMHLFGSFVLFLVALVPIALVTGLLSVAALLTQGSFLIAEQSLTVALEWFFIMLPFCLIVSPVIVFFFNFAAESHLLMQRITQPSQ